MAGEAAAISAQSIDTFADLDRLMLPHHILLWVIQPGPFVSVKGETLKPRVAGDDPACRRATT
jgi:hypothetical protein